MTAEKQSETHQYNLKKQAFTAVASALIASGITEFKKTHYIHYLMGKEVETAVVHCMDFSGNWFPVRLLVYP